jgi:hypothetical protein
MTLTVQPVDANYISQVWPLVEKYLSDALVEGAEKEGIDLCYNIHHAQAFLTNGTWLLLVAVDEQNNIHGAAAVSFINYPLHRVAFITLTGGKLVLNRETFKQLKEILRQRGATKVQAYGRDSMVRLLQRTGFKPQTTLVEVQL